MIRYVDSAGWTWEVCELADRPALGASPADVPADRHADGFADSLAVRPGRADRRVPLADARPADAALDRLGPLDVPGELYFFSRVGARKLRDYPPTWTQLSRTGLEALCDRAQDLDGLRAT